MHAVSTQLHLLKMTSMWLPPGCDLALMHAQADTEHKLSSWLVETFANSPMGLTSKQGAIALEYASASPDVNGAACLVHPSSCPACMSGASVHAPAGSQILSLPCPSLIVCGCIALVLCVAGKNGWYVGSPELGLVNIGNAHLRKNPQAPLVNDEEACRKLYNKSLAILKQCDPSFTPTSGPIEPTYVTAT
jgi:hypothetical protein